MVTEHMWRDLLQVQQLVSRLNRESFQFAFLIAAVTDLLEMS
jgi:hypothetical protein